jgi:hypothetical protein
VRLSELYAQLKTAGDVHAFSVYLATPDLDGVDVDLIPVGWVGVDYENTSKRVECWHVRVNWNVLQCAIGWI